MNKLFFAALLIITASMVACNNADSGKDVRESAQNLKEKADSLYDSILKGHDVGMAKYEKLKRARTRTQEMIDSLDKLPAQARKASADLRARLSSLGQELADAKDGMDKWMAEINFDTLSNDIQEKVHYYTSENEKTQKMKAAILNSLQKADSLLKTKF